MLADRILAVPRSPFYSIMELAQQRGDCIYLQLGEPDFVTPVHIREAIKKALDEGHTHYGSDRGAPELRQQLAKKLAGYGVEYDWRDEILVTAGGQAALHVAVMSLVNPGEEIIILLPHYPPYVCCAAPRRSSSSCSRSAGSSPTRPRSSAPSRPRPRRSS